MGTAVVLGGSVIGSALALQLARSGWRVQLVDPEFDRFTGDGAELTARPGAPHTVQAHGFPSRSLWELRSRLPDVADALLAAGVPEVPLAALAPPELYDGGREGDDQLTCMRSRRLTLDRVVGDIASREPGVERVRERVVGLVLEEGSLPAVAGARLGSGAVLPAELMVDAGGRRSPVTGWLAEAGVWLPERVDPCEVTYYTRHFGYRPAAAPRLRQGFAEVHEFPSFVQLLFLGDNETAMLATAVHGRDPMLKCLHREEAFMALMAANTDFAGWASVLEPRSPVFAMGAFANRMRRLVTSGRPLVRGLHQVGDALAMTNPTRGRGISMGLAAAGVLHDLVTEHPGPDERALAFDEWCSDVLAVYYRETALSDAALQRRFSAGLAGQSVPANAPAVELPEGHAVTSEEIEAAAGADPDLFRTFVRPTMLMDDRRDVALAEVATRTRELLAAGAGSTSSPPAAARPLDDRGRLEELMATWA